MSRASLQKWLLGDSHFHKAVCALEADTVRAQFPKIVSYRSEHDWSPQWPYLLFCASILAPSDYPAAEETALRIAQCALLDKDCTASERDAALVILDTLSNRQAIALAVERECARPSIEERLGTAQSIDWARRSLEHRIELSSGKTLFANRFQRRFWAAAEDYDWLSVSAPTSAGKSFILAQWLADGLATDKFDRIIYLAPTRALVQQVENDLRSILSVSGISGVDIRSLPFGQKDPNEGKEVFVFTQERLHYFLRSAGASSIDALLIDEAHKVGDSYRGVLLQDVLEQVIATNPDARVIFISPLTENPKALLDDAPEGARKEALESDDATVNQNLLWIEQAQDDPRAYLMSLRRGETSFLLGRFDAPARLPQIRERLATLAILTDTGDGGILVYADGAAEAEKLAAAIANKLGEVPISGPLQALDHLCEDTIHKNYKLREVVKKQVAFHYGNMPLLLRTAIEDLFRAGEIRYLVCTSTLIEGVNLPCRSILVRAPKKGSKPMAPADFWNLAGRAGRWGKEFQGNIICVDTDNREAWGETLPDRRGKYRIERTTDRLLANEGQLLDYIDDGAPSLRAKTAQDLESAVAYFSAVRGQYGSLMDAPWSSRIEPNALAAVDKALSSALSAIDPIPNDLLRRHSGISPFAISRMRCALLELKGPIEEFLPVDPDVDDAARQYGRIFQLMGHHMTFAFGSGARCNSLGILTTNWMLGHPIKRLIAARIQNRRKRGKPEEIAKTIRQTLEDVEQIARFQAPRYLACYNEIARLVLDQKGMKETLIPDLTLQLEFGVRGPVQLTLMSLGLSRSSTLAISEAVSMHLDLEELPSAEIRPEAIARIVTELTIEALDLSPLIEAEVLNFQRIIGEQLPLPEPRLR